MIALRTLPVAAAASVATLALAAPATAETRVLTLSQAVAAAIAHQPSLRQARASTAAAGGRVEQARSGYFPQAVATASYQRTTGNFAPRPSATTTLQAPPTISATSYNYFSLNANASQLIYDFGQTGGRADAARANEEAAAANEQTTLLQVTSGVKRLYFQTRAQQELVRVARDAVANQEKHVAQVSGLVRAGMRPDIDLARVRTDLANARVQLISAENGVALAKAQLDQLMGTPTGGAYELGDEELPAVNGEDGPPEALYQAALGSRPELTSLARARRAAEAAVTGLRGSYGPALSANGGASLAGTSVDHAVPNWAVGATLTWPFFQGGLTQGQLREARATLSGVEAQVDALKLQVRVDVEQAQLQVRAAKAGGVAAKEAEASAAEQLRLAEGRYAAGLGSVIELGDAQVAFTNAAAQAVQARYSLAAARAQLSGALGSVQ